ncbi:MAG: hypothetical protein SangKO_001320 [Sandaracinaceae bacterium]
MLTSVSGGESINDEGSCRSLMAKFTDKQGQYLAFIHAYTKLNRRPPAESDMERFSR